VVSSEFQQLTQPTDQACIKLQQALDTSF